jgi:hypothetical protein
MSKKQIAEEELKRALLLMKYDNRKTLTENKEKILKEDIGTGTVAAGSAIGGAAVGAAAAATGSVGGYTALGSTAFAVGNALGLGATAGMAIVGGAAAVAVLPLAYWLITKDGAPAARVKNMIQLCSSEAQNIAKLEKKMTDVQYREMADAIYDSVEGIGTDEDKLFSTFKSLESGTAADACAMINRFNREYGDLFEFLDDDIDQESEWDQIYRPLRNCVEDSLIKLKEENPCKEGEIFDDKQQKCVKVSPTPVPVPTQWRECEFPLVVGCKGENVRKVQECLGIDADGKFGKGTKKAVNNNGYGDDVSKEDYDKIIAKCGGSTPTPTPYEVNPSIEPAVKED